MPHESQFESLGSPGAAFHLGFLLHHDAVNELPNVAHDRTEFRVLGRTAAGQPADLIAPASPGKARDKQCYYGSGKGYETEGNQHESLRPGLAPLGIAQVVHE